MIATLTGIIAEKLSELAVVDVRGVGYGVFLTAEDHGRLNQSDPVHLYVYEHLRENVHDLFGFVDVDTKSLFEQLLSVNGVGPRMAISILSIGTSQQVRQAIANGDVKFIQLASGVGKRVAERIVVDLRDKVGIHALEAGQRVSFDTSRAPVVDDATQALISLGYTAQDAVERLQDIDVKLSTEERVRLALKETGHD